MHGGAAAQGWINANAPQLQQAYVKQQEQQKEAAQKWAEKKKAEEQAAKQAEKLANLSDYSAEKQDVVQNPRPPKVVGLPGAEFAAQVVTAVQNFSVKVIDTVNQKSEDVKQWAQTKYDEAKDTVKTKIEEVKKILNEPFGYLKKSNPPPWLSISGGASLLEQDLFSNDYIGLSSGTGGFWKRFFYEKQTVKYSASTTGTRNPNGFVEVDVTEGKTSVELGKLTIYGKPLTAEIGFTIKNINPDDPYHYTEDVYALDYGWMSSGWITATNKVTIEPSSTSDFEIKTTETIEGKIRKIKGEGPVMIIVGAVALYYAWPVILPFLPEIKKLIPAWN